MASTAVQLLPPPTHRSRTSTAGSASTPPPAAAASSSSRSSSATFSRSQSFSGLGGRPPRQKALSGPTKPAFLYTYSSSLAELAASGGDDGSGSAARTDGPDERPDYLRPSRAGHRLIQSRTMPLRGDGGLDSVAVGGDSGEVESGLPLRRSRKETLPADYWAKAKREPSAAGNTSPSATAALIRPGRRATTGARGAGPVSAGPSTSKSAAPTAPTLGRRPTIVEELEAKIVFLGSAGVGKTSIIRRFTTRKFGPTKTTVGSGLSTRKQVIDGVHVRLQLWDAAGQERYRSLAPMYYRGAHVAILVYDVTRRASFAELESWLSELREKGPSDVVIHVVGAKADLEGQREVDLSTARRELRFWLNPFAAALPNPTSDVTSAPPTPSLSDDGVGGAGSGFFSGRIRRKSGDWASAGGVGGSMPKPAVPTSTTAGSADGQGSTQPVRRKSEEWSRRTPMLGDDYPAASGSTAAAGMGAEPAPRRRVSFRRDEQAPRPAPPADADEDAGLEGIKVWETSASTSKGIEPLFLHITRQLIDRGDELERERLRRARESVVLDDGDGTIAGTDATSTGGRGTSSVSDRKQRRLGGACCT